ncbi:uncharacterized protein LOC124661872 [Lolium rigidum]|uniref:uncharacterized protein LOC124661872 n=1 Tax=Lolium rigidum TaxID=89674 RepID=UPI001F5D2D93|nr:uncharacterized protein LOC124661872 [Lolium rigidum]
MAFKQVFYALREVFPQVDLRILKAVASQYSSDVDAAVGFVYSDVLPAVSEPTETHYALQDIDFAEHDHTDFEKPNLQSGRISLVDLGAQEDASVLFGMSAENSRTVGECNPFLEYDGPFCSNNKIENCSQIEDKVVINETRIPTTAIGSLLQEHYFQVESSRTSATEPRMIEYEQSACNDHCASEKDKVTPETENIGNLKQYNDNFKLSDLFASSGSMLPLFMESSSGCAVKHEEQVPLKPTNAVSGHDIASSEDNCYLETLFVNFHSNEDRETSNSLLDAPTVHTLSKAKDNYDLQVLFENIDTTGKESGVLCTAENHPELNNLANDGSFHNLFAELCTIDKTTEVPSNFPGKGGSDIVHKEQQTLIHSNNCGAFTSTWNFNDDKHFVCPIVELDAFRPNEEWKMPGAHKSEGILDISTHSYHITDLNKNISDTTKSKELLTSLYESTIMKMEVELQEENSRLAKQNANKAHQNYLAMVEHFNQLIENSKESNDKQAQVVGEEKCLLVTLTQDLQSRLTKLSAQRDEALTTVQEIKCELDARLATSMEEEATALEDIMQKEKVALLVRNDKEGTMRSIMEESRKLQKEAEENILLRGLLLDQGRLIDIMQGEISSIHANVVAMKERISGSKLKSALVLTSCSAHSYHKDDCKSASVDTDWPMGNVDNINDLPQEQITRSLAKDHATSSDDDEGWEVLETNNA